jgi:calcium-dependent protein kinase
MGNQHGKHKSGNDDTSKVEQFKSLYYLNDPVQEIYTSPSNTVFKITSDVYDTYTKLKDLQSGTTGSVSKILHKELNIQRALKLINIKDNPKLLNEAKREISILKNLDHPNIEKIYEYYEKDNDTISIVMELISGQDLFDKLMKVNRFSEQQTAIIMYQIFSSIKLCHDNGIIHRDIKAENIIIQDDLNLFVKLIDFGSCEILTKTKLTSTYKVGSPSYIAPEILNGEEYDYSCDIWSLGVLMYYLLCGNKPFKGNTEEEIYKSIKTKDLKFKDKVWEKISDEAKNLIKSMLVKNKKMRFNINQVLHSDWLIKNISKTDNSKKLHNEQYLKEKIIPNIRKFKNINQIQLLALFYVIHNQIDFSKNEEIIQITKEFYFYDKDGDGKLSEEELYHMLLDGGVTKEDLNHIINDIWNIFGDSKGKFLTYESFILLSLNNKKDLVTDKIIQKLFLLIDTKKTLKITMEDLQNIYEGQEELEKKKINPMVWENFYKKMGLNNQEPITYSMFSKYLKNIDL